MEPDYWQCLRDLRASIKRAERTSSVDLMRRQPFIDALPEIVKALTDLDERLAKVDARE